MSGPPNSQLQPVLLEVEFVLNLVHDVVPDLAVAAQAEQGAAAHEIRERDGIEGRVFGEFQGGLSGAVARGGGVAASASA